MKPRPLRSVAPPDAPTGPADLPALPPRGATAGPAARPDLPPCDDLVGVTAPTPDEPLAVVATGPGGAARAEVLATLLGVPPARLAAPAESYLVATHARACTRSAHVPGYRQPHPWAGGPELAPAPSRPPRRVETTLDEPLLGQFGLVVTPDTDGLGVAGARVLLDAVGRAGALLVVIAADQTFVPAELDLLAAAGAAGVAIFLVVTPGTTGWDRGAAPETTVWADGTGAPCSDTVTAPDAAPPPTPTTGSAGPGQMASPAAVPDRPGQGTPSPDPAVVTVAAHRAALLAALPGLVGASWFPFRPDGLAALRQALRDWAALEGPRRLAAGPEAVHRPVPVPAGVDGGWVDLLDRQSRAAAQRIRHDLALELAGIHLRAVQEIVFRSGCAGLPRLLDRELHALSLLATARSDRAVRRLVTDTFAKVFGTAPDPAALRRVTTAVRRGLGDQPSGRDLARVLLVTSTGGIAGLSGPGAFEALDVHPGAPRAEVLPPLALALSGGCYQHLRGPGRDDPGGARSWVQVMLREIERELQQELTRRFEVVRLSLGAVLTDAVDHGLLLA